MGRTKGSKNRNIAAPSYIELPSEQRVTILANLIVDTIYEDLQKGQPLLKKIEGEHHASRIDS